MKTLAEVRQWIQGALREFGDPSVPIGQLFIDFKGKDDLRVEYQAPELRVCLGVDILPLTISAEGPAVEDGRMSTFGIEKICDGVWTLNPSCNMPGLIHAFVILYNVPAPAPWERRIWLPGDPQ